MPRPVKRKKVCCLPETNLFGPLNAKNMDADIIMMSVEEYETIRLIDLEGMLQEECAESMKVARTTVQRIYNDARKKLANALVNGIILKIEGGNYKLCEEGQQVYGCGRCRKKRIKEALEQSKKQKNIE
ncbi:DUF134 domain-containing protein [Acetobacterium bakii]|uniref:UPF0251 protein AKG39_16030 n=1 Tax=Acetobacterium bakii TaxID=52689 RepID=A0A0L6TWP5_9FIRM|nr:DUF134 domain-containing protein [Acetobacterium bakii]KNZ40696.1 hypothetical protein AKG39_16030 [Acetobacterium bakii]